MVGFDIAGAERPFPPILFREAYAEEPFIKGSVIIPERYVGAVMELVGTDEQDRVLDGIELFGRPVQMRSDGLLQLPGVGATARKAALAPAG